MKTSDFVCAPIIDRGLEHLGVWRGEKNNSEQAPEGSAEEFVRVLFALSFSDAFVAEARTLLATGLHRGVALPRSVRNRVLGSLPEGRERLVPDFEIRKQALSRYTTDMLGRTLQVEENPAYERIRPENALWHIAHLVRILDGADCSERDPRSEKALGIAVAGTAVRKFIGIDVRRCKALDDGISELDPLPQGWACNVVRFANSVATFTSD